MYGGEVEGWGDPFANNMFYYDNNQLDDEGRYISAAVPPTPPGASPSLLYPSPNKFQQLQNRQAIIASNSPTKRGQSSSKIQPSPLRVSSKIAMVASGNNTESQKENQPVHARESLASIPAKTDPVVRLYDWYIGLQPTQQALSYYSEAKGVKKWIQIFGIRYRSEEDDDPKGKRKADDKGEPWHSSLISERISSNLVKSKSGKIYELMGTFDETSSCKRKKVSPHTAAQFRNGFPANWADIVCEEARSSKGKKVKPKSPSKRNSDQTQTQNTSTQEVRAHPITETQTFPKVQNSSQRPKPRPSVSGKQLPEPKSQPKARKKKSLFRDDTESSESEYHPSSDGASKKKSGKAKGKHGGKRGRNDEDDDDDNDDSEGEDSLYEEVVSKAKKKAKKGSKGKTIRRKSKDADMISEDEGISSMSPSPELNGQKSSLHQMNDVRSRKQSQEQRLEQPIRARKSMPMPLPREISPPSSPLATEESGKKAKPIPRELRNLSKTGFGRLTLVQNAIMEQLEQNRSERKRFGRQSLPSMRTNAPQTPLSQIGNHSNAISPRSSTRTRTPVKPWWEVQPSTKSKSKPKKSLAKSTGTKKPQLFNMNSSSSDEEEEEEEQEEDASYDNTFAHSKPTKNKSMNKQEPIQISSDEEDEYEKQNVVQDLMEERQIEEHIDLQSSPSHGKGSTKRIGNELIGPIEKRARMDVIEHRAEEQIDQQKELYQDTNEDHQMEEQEEQTDDLNYIDDVFDQLPEQHEGIGNASEVEGIVESNEEEDEIPNNSVDSIAENESVNGNLAQVIEEPQVEALPAEIEMLQDRAEVANTSKELPSASESARSSSSITPDASDQNTNETTADPIEIPSPFEGDQPKQRFEDHDKGESTPTMTDEKTPNHHDLEGKDEYAKEINDIHSNIQASSVMETLRSNQANHKTIEVVVIEDSDDEQEESVQTTSVLEIEEEMIPNTDAQEEAIVTEIAQSEERHQSVSDAEQEAALEEVITQTVDEESNSSLEEALKKNEKAIPLQTITHSENPSENIETTTQVQADVTPIIDDDIMQIREEDDVPSATLPTEKESEHAEVETGSNSDATQIQKESEESPDSIFVASQEKEVETALPNIEETTKIDTPVASHIEPTTLAKPISLTPQPESTPTNDEIYPHLSEREEQEVSVEFEALQIESEGGVLSVDAIHQDLAYNVEPIELVEEPQAIEIKTNEGTGRTDESMDVAGVESMVLQIDTNQDSFAGNDKIVSSMEVMDRDRITHEDPHPIIISTDKLPAPISPLEDEEMDDDDDNESVVSLSEVYYFSD